MLKFQLEGKVKEEAVEFSPIPGTGSSRGTQQNSRSNRKSPSGDLPGSKCRGDDLKRECHPRPHSRDRSSGSPKPETKSKRSKRDAPKGFQNQQTEMEDVARSDEAQCSSSSSSRDVEGLTSERDRVRKQELERKKLETRLRALEESLLQRSADLQILERRNEEVVTKARDAERTWNRQKMEMEERLSELEAALAQKDAAVAILEGRDANGVRPKVDDIKEGWESQKAGMEAEIRILESTLKGKESAMRRLSKEKEKVEQVAREWEECFHDARKEHEKLRNEVNGAGLGERVPPTRSNERSLGGSNGGEQGRTSLHEHSGSVFTC